MEVRETFYTPLEPRSHPVSFSLEMKGAEQAEVERDADHYGGFAFRINHGGTDHIGAGCLLY